MGSYSIIVCFGQGMHRQKLFTTILFFLFLSSCSESKIALASEPQVIDPIGTVLERQIVMIKPGESVEIVTPTPLVAEQKTRMYDSVYLTDTEIIKTSNSSQPQIRLAGILPSSCHKLLLKVDNIDVDNNILIKVFSTVSFPNSCSQEKQLFDNILVLDGLKPGIYTVWVSQGKIGDVTIP